MELCSRNIITLQRTVTHRCNDDGVGQERAVELIAECHPARVRVVWATKDLCSHDITVHVQQVQTARSEHFARTEFASARQQALEQAVDLVGFAAGLAHLGDEDVAVEVAVERRLALDADDAVLLAVVQPVTRATCATSSR